MRPSPPGKDGGFSLLEALIALALFLVAAAFAAQLLLETSQQLTDAAAEQVEAPMPLVRARLRADVQSSGNAACVYWPDETPREARMLEHPAGTVIYRVHQGVLWRLILDKDGKLVGQSPILRGVASWKCLAGGGLIWIELTHDRRAVRRTPLVVAPEARGPLVEPSVDAILLAPRGAGLGDGW